MRPNSIFPKVFKVKAASHDTFLILARDKDSGRFIYVYARYGGADARKRALHSARLLNSWWDDRYPGGFTPRQYSAWIEYH